MPYFEGKDVGNREIYDLLIRIDKGYMATDYENRILRSVKTITWRNITKLPNSMGILTSLKNLNLNNNTIRDISVLSSLTSLSYLKLKNTKVSNIIALTNMKDLLELDLCGTDVSDICALADKTNLIKLNLHGTKVSDISVLSNKPNLLQLDLGGTEVSDISVLSNMPNLTQVNLENTKVNDISALSDLKKMKILDLSGIKINKWNVFSEQHALERLNLQYLKANEIPESILDLDLEFIVEEEKRFSLKYEKGIYIYGLTLTDQPIEIFNQKRDLIHAYYRERIQVPVNECKVIFLGDADSGKTHSIKRLLKHGEFLEDYEGKPTPGIETTVSRIKVGDSEIFVNYWDFGGQEIQHSMHRMFLTDRTVYVVFLNARQDDQIDERAIYWMENIKTFAPKAPVLVVINKLDLNNDPKINEKGLVEAYRDQVKRVIRMSAEKDEPRVFLDELQGNINSIIMGQSIVSKKIPKSWKNLIENIREMEKNYLTAEKFIEKCESNGIKDYKKIHDELIDLFQEIGVSFCYRQNRSVADYMLLEPKWMLNAVYSIVVNGKAVSQNGVITQDDLYDLLQKDTINGVTINRVDQKQKYKTKEINYILGVIRMFGLSYCLKNGSEFFPMLCEADESISVSEVVPNNALHCIFRYEYLPKNTMHRLIVEMQRDLDYPYVWYTGAVFRNKLQNQSAYIYTKKNDLHIYVYGEEEYYNLNEYLTPISNNVRNINKDLGISAIELLTLCQNGIEAEIPREEAEGNLRNGVDMIYNAKIKGMVALEDLTHRYFTERSRKNVLLESIISALQEMQNKMIYYSCDEDPRNSFVASQLTAQFKGKGYTCSEQQPGGVGAGGKASGERDIVVKDENGQEILIYEGMNLSGFDKAYISDHIKKVLVNYNPQGLRYSVLVTYLECGRDQFGSFTNKYREHIEKYAPETYTCIGKAKNVPVEGEFLVCIKMDYKVGGSYLVIYHIVVRLGA